MAVVKAINLPGTGLIEEPIEVDITEGPIRFYSMGMSCNVTDVNAIDELQKALAVWVAWKRLSED
jgi:hypothetical protein